MTSPYAVTHVLLAVLSKPDPRDIVIFPQYADDPLFRGPVRPPVPPQHSHIKQLVD